MRLSPRNLAVAGLVTLLPSLALGGGIPTATQWLEEVVVTGKLERLGGEPASATVGIATSEQLDLRPVLRTGELLEVVPGLIVTQHSGSGKANQYFLRGFNLDHGTDLATSVDGVPVKHADARARPGLHRHQLRHSGAGRVDRVSQGHVLRRDRAISPRPAREPALSLGARRAVRRPSKAARTITCADCRRLAGDRRRPLLMALRAFDDERPVAAGREIPQDQRAAALLA